MKTIGIGSILTDGQKQYKITDFVNNGGFSIVFKATCESRSYAIKVLSTPDPHSIFSLKNEFEIAIQIQSDNAVNYYYINDYGQNDYPCFIIMEYLDGGSLRDELEKHVSYSTEQLLAIYSQLINGMIDISKTAVHRDIKPENILLSNGVYKISDYGLAKYFDATTRSASKTMKGYGSLYYIAPELWDDPKAHDINDTKVDIYAMGIVFYELANSGMYPYETCADLKEMHMSSAIKPFNKEVDPVIQNMIKKMMARSRKDRFDTWEEIRAFLSNTSIVRGIKRDPFVNEMLNETIQKQQSIDSKNAEKAKIENERILRFKRLVSRIYEKIYSPLYDLVSSYNDDTINGRYSLGKIETDEEDETFSFQFAVSPLSEDEDERIIDFNFSSKKPEMLEHSYLIPTKPFDQYEERDWDINRLFNFTSNTIEYKYNGKRILLWGTIKADCGLGINVAILEDADEPLYGTVKSFIRTPNVHGSISWVPIETDSDLKKVCSINFKEHNYSTNVSVTYRHNYNFLICPRIKRGHCVCR